MSKARAGGRELAELAEELLPDDALDPPFVPDPSSASKLATALSNSPSNKSMPCCVFGFPTNGELTDKLTDKKPYK